jgi:hypothetical protein
MNTFGIKTPSKLCRLSELLSSANNRDDDDDAVSTGAVLEVNAGDEVTLFVVDAVIVTFEDGWDMIKDEKGSFTAAPPSLPLPNRSFSSFY